MPTRRRPSRVSATTRPPPGDRTDEVRIVGIGCSAGGLEALTAFFNHVSPGNGLAFVVVQHLDPARPSSLPALLQRTTALPVCEATQGMEVRADTVYVIPPNKSLTVLCGTLQLLEPTEPSAPRLSVDEFLRSLAGDCKQRSIGVVLSGMGSDGVLGLRAIRECGGLTLAQEPATAVSASMPASALAAGVVDVVAAAHELPGRIVEALQRTPRLSPGAAAAAPAQGDEDSLGAITVLLRGRSGNDFSLYKIGTLQRRVERRVALHRLGSAADYLAYLRNNPHELDLLFKEMLIGVTGFFRDPDVWEALHQQILPAALARHPDGRAFRAWVPACSSGEEAYTLAMVFRDAVADAQPSARFTLQIYATDLDADAVAKARKGVYPKNIADDVGSARLARYFVDQTDNYRVAKEVRDMVTFAQQNVVSDPPFTKLDILTCRNLLIYFGPELQRRALPMFHYALNPGGVLILGSSETIGHFDQLFTAEDARHHIYRRLNEPTPISGVSFLTTLAMTPPETPAGVLPPGESIGQLTDQLVQQTYAPAAVLVNAEGDILYISGRTGKYLEPAAGRVNVNIHAMARQGLDTALIGVIRTALGQSEPVHLRGVKIGTNGGTQLVDVTVQGLEHPEALRGRALVVFKDVAAPARARRTAKTAGPASGSLMLQELTECREALRALRRETQTSLEELKSANEELQATNEEMQSTNEELTTSKEEMQSMNEEMRTVNTELQSKVHDLTWERNDMSNLLNSTEIATIFLDNDMRLRRFTAFATKLFKLIPSDVGRPLSDLVTELDYATFDEDARDVLRTLAFSEKEVGTADGRCYRVRIMPYRTQDNMIDGVVSTFVDVTQTKALENELRRLGGTSA